MKFAMSTLIALATMPALAESFAVGPFALKIASSPSVTTRLSAAGPPTNNSRGEPDNFSLSPDEYNAFSRFGEDMLKQAFPKLSEKDMKAVNRFGNEIFKPVLRNYVPGYEVIDDGEKFSVQVDVPGVKAEDLNIHIEDGGKVLTLSGSRKNLRDGQQSYASDFSESFQVDPAVVDIENFSADLEDGVLVVSAPKFIAKEPEVSPANTKQSIPITTQFGSGGAAGAMQSPTSSSTGNNEQCGGSPAAGDGETQKSSSRDIQIS
mmetsp:Transcript_13083/g.21670  ORF Transcript_13083/g.21670 Transcript_13083/m.21670 type:complete len:263 (+) Transcript_13083:84-872(+)|eukprot:CAMPEP_0119003850 /NCGR_PEP_ID=MMETSP1176-20130426/799_1 /TAXON_ID=265551 /ORGANISM="Synedropsis recta cf, Strain CCMP1620" /LENGTH=262 /DNA_ID=CAMNT_0006955487 /DNA_START=81 /DNA_END=869 /DNA_ORIENTATION=+